MSLPTGTTLAHYEILEPIGKGGMGEVYRAKDSKLGREVAIKVLPDEFAQDEERLRRFQREAKVLASLNHPNIAAIYGLEHSGQTHYLVLELVPGETLAERIARGPMPVEEALAIGTKITEALEEAHEQGIVHRDLKPANVKLTPDDKVKVLDFGLAKAFVEEGPERDAASSMSPTITRDATRVGVILGTAAYMSPEQAKGKRVDRRADIWAFGAVVFEMLTGRRAFEGEDVSDTLAAVLRAEPDLDTLPADTPESLRLALRLCLRKNVPERVQSIGDVRLALGGAFETDAPRPLTVVRRGVGWPAVGLALLLGSVVTGIAIWSMRPKAPISVVRSTVNSPSLPPSLSPLDADLTITPDGTRIVYLSLAGERRLVVRDVQDLEALTLSEDGSLRSPFVSPDGAFVGFFSGGTLQKVSILGGPPETICEVRGGARGASWGDDGTIVFATNVRSGLMRVAASGGEPEELTVVGPEERDHYWPEFLPGGEAVLFTIRGDSGGNDNQIAVVSLRDGTSKTLISQGRSPRYASTGHIVYANRDALLAVGFDLERLEVTTDPVPIGLSGVATEVTGAADFAISDNGSLAYLTGPSVSNRRTLAWVDREGREQPIGAEPRGYVYPSISPDGARVALDVCCDEDENGIWILDFARQSMTRLTADPNRTYHPVWTPDGSRVAFASNRDGVFNLFWKVADGAGAVERLSESAYSQVPLDFAPDGQSMVFRARTPETRDDLFVRTMDESGTTERLVITSFSEGVADVSPDGRWLAYRSDATGQGEIWVRPFPNVDGGGEWQVSRGGGHRPRWSPAGSELFYLSPSGQLMSVRYQADTTFTSSTPERVLDDTFFTSGVFGAIYDVHPDGQRFLKIKEGSADDGSDPPQVVLVQNWIAELKRLVPTE